MKLHRKADKNQLEFSEASQKDILKLLDEAAAYLTLLYEAMEQNEQNILAAASAKTTTFNRMTKECRRNHLARISEEQASPMQSLIFTDILKTFRLINDHLHNAAEAAAGEK